VRVTLSSAACNAGKGLAAGVIGTAAMTVSSTLEARIRRRPPSTAPADAAAKVLGIAQFTDDRARSRFSTVVHWSYGTGWGLVRGMLAEAGLGPGAATAVHLAVVWGSELVMLPALGVAPPVTEWQPEEIAIDAAHHVVYALGTTLGFALLQRR
jgi:hypothetical protein